MSNYLVLAADQGRARLFKSENRNGPMQEIETLTNPQARLKEQDLVSDAAGGNPHDVGSQTHAHAHAAEVFAKVVSQALDQATTEHKAERIYVLAAHQFLGLLRPHWSHAVKAKIAEEYAKDVSHQTAEQIRQHLPELL